MPPRSSRSRCWKDARSLRVLQFAGRSCMLSLLIRSPISVKRTGVRSPPGLLAQAFLLLVALVLCFDLRQRLLMLALVKLALAFAGAAVWLTVEELDHLFFVVHPYADGVEHVAVAGLVTIEDFDGLGGCCLVCHFSFPFADPVALCLSPCTKYTILSRLCQAFFATNS